jgi:hypothetical protein
MGHVYLALDPNIERKVALKIFLPLLKVGVAEEWELRQRFIVEARAAGQLNHPGIVTIFDADTDADTGLSYLAMEWVNGPSLDDLIREAGPLPIERTVSIVEQVAIALDVAHRQGLVHRDIKPGNILLQTDGRAKVTDFGIAKLASMSITATGWIPGTPFYMSPEQIRNEGIDRRSDFYSLGAVLYQCLTGTVPFEAESLAALTHMILEIDPRPPQSLNPAVTEAIAKVIRKAMAKSPDDRFDSGSELARVLRRAVAGELDEVADLGSLPDPRPRVRAREATGLAGSGTATVGLEDGPVDSLVDEPVDVGVATRPLSAPAELSPDLPPLPADPPAEEALIGQLGGRRLALALGAALALMVIWSLRPVESEPTRPAGRGSERMFVEMPRFGHDLSASGSGIALPPQIAPPEARADSWRPTSQETGWPRSRQPVATPASSSMPSTEPLPIVEATPRMARLAAESRPKVSSTLEVVYRNRLKGATISVSIDGEKIWARDVANAGSFLKRAMGRDVWTTLAVPAGEHVVDVRVTGSEGKLDVVRQADATFEDGKTHRLRVVLVPPKTLKLAWKETSPG